MMMKKTAVIVALSLCFCLLVSCGGSKSGSGSSGGGAASNSGSGKTFKSAEIYLDTTIMLAGTESCLRVHADDWILSYGEEIELSSSNESVATVEKDASNEAMIIKGVSAGTSTITAKMKGAEASAEIRVVDHSGEAEGVLDLSADKIEVPVMGSAKVDAVLSNVPSDIKNVSANIYHSRELFGSAKGSWNGNVLSLEISCMDPEGEAGTFEIVITDSANPDRFVAAIEIPVEVVKG